MSKLPKASVPLVKLRELAGHLGIHVKIGSEANYKPERKGRHGWVRWITLDVSTNDILYAKELNLTLAIGLAHEIGHYIAASKSRRNKENFGLERDKSFFYLDEAKAFLIEDILRKHFEVQTQFDILDIDKISNPELLKVMPEAKKWFEVEGKQEVEVLLEFLS